MVDEVGKFPALVDLFASTHDRFGEWPRTTAEDSDFADVAVFLLHEFQEGRHVGSAEVVDRLESGEHTALGDALEVVLTDVQHGGAQVELVEELRDEDVHLQHVGHVLALDVTQHVDEPFKVAVGRARPQEIHLIAQKCRLLIDIQSTHYSPKIPELFTHYLILTYTVRISTKQCTSNHAINHAIQLDINKNLVRTS